MNRDAPVEGWAFSVWHDKVYLTSTALVVLAIAAYIVWRNIAGTLVLVLTAALWFMVLYFFRNPQRKVLEQSGVVVGPCDGKVVEILRMVEGEYLNREAIRISVFLSVLDVHVQRAPLAGRVALVEHHPGKFLQAFRPAASQTNDHIAMLIETDRGPILVKQIAGILARRCMNFARVGDELQSGQRFGLIRFGSRVDLFLPARAEVLTEVGDQVYGGITPVALLRDNEIDDAE